MFTATALFFFFVCIRPASFTQPPPPPSPYRQSNLVYPDKRYTNACTATLTSTFHFGKKILTDTAVGKQMEKDSRVFATTYKLGGPPVARDPTLLAAYRAEHTTEARGTYAVTERFLTGAALSTGGAAVPACFQPVVARARAGAVKSADVLLARAVEKLGWDGALRLRFELPEVFDKLALRSLAVRLRLQPLTVNEEKELLVDLTGSLAGHDQSAPLAALMAAVLPGEGAPARSTAGQDDPELGGRGRGAAAQRAWAAIRDATASVRGAGAEPTLATVRMALDAALHPDVRRKPRPLRSAASAEARVLEGLSAALRAVHGLPLPAAAQAAEAAAAARAAEARAVADAAPQAPDGSIVSRTMSSSVPQPLGMSKRVANGDHLVVKGTMVGIKGRLHADPAAGVSTGSGSGAPPPAGLGQTATECMDWGVNLFAAGGSGGGGGGGGGGGPSSGDPLVKESAWFEQLPGDTPVSFESFRFWCRHLSAATPSDDSFCRAMGALFHVGVAPSVPESYPAPRTEGVNVPDRDRGEKTAYAEVGAGLAFATFPYDPSLRSQPPPRQPPLTDPDFAFSQGAAPAVALLVTHSDGRKSLQRVRVNRYTHSEGSGAAGHQLALLHALRMAGVADAVSASVDF